MHLRQAPQEIIEPNEVEEEEQPEIAEKKDDDASSVKNEEAPGEEEIARPEAGKDFKEVKLCTKNGAFLIHKPGKGTFFYYATQNSRVKGDVPKQKLQI